jgi:hypothetical protein
LPPYNASCNADFLPEGLEETRSGRPYSPGLRSPTPSQVAGIILCLCTKRDMRVAWGLSVRTKSLLFP